MRQKRLFSIGILCALLAIGTHILSAAEKARSRVEIPKSIVEQVLNHAKLQGFLHPEALGRVPVVISSHLINPRLPIRKFGKPVRIVPDAKLKSGAFLRFTNFDVGQTLPMLESSISLRAWEAALGFVSRKTAYGNL